MTISIGIFKSQNNQINLKLFYFPFSFAFQTIIRILHVWHTNWYDFCMCPTAHQMYTIKWMNFNQSKSIHLQKESVHLKSFEIAVENMKLMADKSNKNYDILHTSEFDISNLCFHWNRLRIFAIEL